MAGSDTAPEDGGRVEHLRASVDQRVSGSFLGQFWKRLATTDFMSQAMQLAAILLLCAAPFAIVVSAFSNRSEAVALSRRLGLNQQAAQDVGRLFAPAHATTGQISGAGYVLFILGGVAAASAIQVLYEQVFELEARGLKNFPREIAWLGLTIGVTFLGGIVSPAVYHAGGPLLLGLVTLVAVTLFWWLTVWLLTAGRVPWRACFPSAVATGVCWIGMYAVFRLVFSNAIVSDQEKYGDIGIIFALMSYLIAIGVVIILGAVFGIFWREQKGRATSTPGSPQTRVDAP